VCIERNGDRACTNTGTFTVKHLVYRDINDTRDCATCTCTPTGVSCGGTTDLYSAAGCTGTMVTTTNDSTSCATTTDVQSMQYHPSGPTGGSCTVGGGAPIGSVSLGDPVTLCCLP
jgi:hypothetical protein